MSEQEPLLPTHQESSDGDVPSQDRFTGYREHTAVALESQTLHRTVILLIIIDAACVLTDIGYAFLSGDCIPAEGPDAPRWLEILSDISLFITTFFLLEIPFTIWAFGLDFYHPCSDVHYSALHLFDAIIIVTTFTLEFVLKGKERELAALLILLRLWRLVKLVGGIAVGAGEMAERTSKELMETQRKLKDTQDALAKARQENEDLKGKLAGTGNEETVS